ncbi:PilC/PilY family type IV pilus protein [Motilimonas sp. 1_MG-2023]|uniref:pilus assembly protein n=1 Tax=Motilimonas sp. 1_MG-2023 TaxID=3062672 RepID=UPI0026E41C02|nr:PilC/PilY family type IV pilus protein [Motilimonas sp. 1_MG-2023]MDO6525687.1 PilC/PilY family type IV pilus protein [Motilimonas sp. 1_MG-2023]
MYRFKFLLPFTALLCTNALADDTELYIADISAQKGLRPQVMIIFDNSGSMRDSEMLTKEAFDPNKDYGESGQQKIYWGAAGQPVPDVTSSNQFNMSENNCQSSINPLIDNGKYTGNLRRWSSKSQTWLTLKKSRGVYFDCREDADKDLLQNPGSQVDGYPINGTKTGYQATKGSSVFIGSDGITLYTEKYLAWYHQPDTVKKSRLSIAQDAISDLVKSTPSVNFGLTVFNYNDSDGTRNGGRVVRAIKDMSTQDRLDFSSVINNQEAKGNTPLCESLYEVYRYFSGTGVYFGDDDADYGGYYLANKPPRDTNAEAPEGTYKSPYKTCQDKAYVILMTDGQPTQDKMADSLIASLTGAKDWYSSYLPTLAKHLNTKDINSDKAGTQTVSTFTIGFGEAATTQAGVLLLETATQGGGEYYPATDAKALQQAFQETIIKILDQSSSFNAPAVSATSFDRTQHQNNVYYSMFMPSKKQRWRGNIKKLTIDKKGILRDANNLPAISANGYISENASTGWGGVNDGNSVSQGGVAAAIAKQTNRKIFTNIQGALVTLNKQNIKTYFNVATDSDLAVELGIDVTNLDEHLNWLLGYDINDANGNNNIADYRTDIFADPLHSKPTAIVYPSGNDSTRLMVGTNAGFVHFFHDEGQTVTEDWAFIPAELLSHGLGLINDKDAASHPYGMDGTATVFDVTQGSTKQLIAVMGMRRGGKSYYAFDITTPTSPKLLWEKSKSDSSFSELGQTWSKPKSGWLNVSGDTIPVFIFGAGYDVNKDNCSGGDNCLDTEGRGIFIVNAKTGELIWSNNTTCSATDAHCMQHSIPSEIATLDSNSDGIIDRLYAGDTGGNLWRIDLKGDSPSAWSTIKLAKLSDATTTGDRRIFTPPTIARSLIQKVIKVDESYQVYDQAVDMVLVGTGNRAKPASDISNQDTFVMIKDTHILPTTFGSNGVEKPTPIKFGDLFDITNNPIESSTDLMLSRATLSSNSGWRYQFKGKGEKSLGGPLVLAGTVYFTSFSPNATANLQCGIGDLGLGKLYAVNLFDGTNTQTWREKEIGNQVPDTIVAHSGEDEQGQSVIRLLGVGQGEQISVVIPEDPNNGTEEQEVNTGTQSTDANMKPNRIYSYFEEL